MKFSFLNETYFIFFLSLAVGGVPAFFVSCFL